jgi:hypothetical protein
MTDQIDDSNKAPAAASLHEHSKDFESQQPAKGADRGAQLIGSQRITLTEEDVSRHRLRDVS